MKNFFLTSLSLVLLLNTSQSVLSGDDGYHHRKPKPKRNTVQSTKVNKTKKTEEKGFSRSSVKKCSETCSIDGH